MWAAIDAYKQKSQSYDQFALMRKFAMILLRDITSGNDSLVKKEFAPCILVFVRDVVH